MTLFSWNCISSSWFPSSYSTHILSFMMCVLIIHANLWIYCLSVTLSPLLLLRASTDMLLLLLPLSSSTCVPTRAQWHTYRTFSSKKDPQLQRILRLYHVSTTGWILLRKRNIQLVVCWGKLVMNILYPALSRSVMVFLPVQHSLFCFVLAFLLLPVRW